MATRSSFNKNNSAVKRIMQEARELQNDPSTEYSAAPLEDNLFEWHCTLRGAPDTDFEGGLYHFRIVLPAEYPFRPPSLMMLTPSGRFETNTKLCISFTNYHEELWQPAWGVRTAIIGLQGFFPLKGQAAMGIGSMEAPASERRRLAKLSRDWVCPQCKIPNSEHLPDPSRKESSSQAPCSNSPASSPASKAAGEAYGSERSKNTADVSTVSDAQRTDANPGETADRRGAEPNENENADVKVGPGAGSPSGATATIITASANAIASANTNAASSMVERQVEIVSVSTSSAPVGSPASIASRSPSGSTSSGSRRPRPPIILDAAISVLLILVAALLARKVL